MLWHCSGCLHKQMIFPSWLQSASSCRQHQAHFKKKCHHSCCTAIGWESRILKCFVNLEAWQVTDDRVFICEKKFSMDFAKTFYQPKPSSSLHSFFRSSIGFQLKIRPRSKSAYSNPGRRPILGQVLNFDLLLCTGFILEHWQHSFFRWLRKKSLQ